MARILIIEDNVANLELMAYLLHAGGHDIDTAPDGEEGLALAARQPAADIIISDVHLPRLDGYEVARQIKADSVLRDIPLVAVTALAMVGDREKVLAAGFDGYIPKPINPREFAAQVQSFLKNGAARVEPVVARHADAPPPQQAAAEQTAAGGGCNRGNGPRILVVDDSPCNRDLARATLEPHGYRVTAVGRVADACARMEEESFDLILSDLHMPDGSGLKLLHAVRDDPRWQQLPFVLTSSSLWGTYDAKRGLAMGADRFLIRPVSPQKILDAVAACLAAVKEQNSGKHPGR